MISDNDVSANSDSAKCDSKKRRRFGRVRDADKKMRRQSHEIGNDCNCTRYQCFKNTTDKHRSDIINYFNSLKSWDEQSSYLTGLISLVPVLRRKNRQKEGEANFRACSFFYKIRVKQELGIKELPICLKAFCAFHGITRRRVATIQNSLKLSGKSPVDGRGKHQNRKHKLSAETVNNIITHIKSFKGRNSHYSIGKSKRLYLPQELTISKMYSMYKKLYPQHIVSYQSYRDIFNTKFNIAFGYPRSDTCSICDENAATLKMLNAKLVACSGDEATNKLNSEVKKLETARMLHLKKAETFYERKRCARKQSRKEEYVEAICMDYIKNLPLPNIATNDVYYKRQLSFFGFNVHCLSNADAIFYAYTEVIAKKGSNEVVSFLDNYITEFLDPRIKILRIFCDSCGGQNKNFTLFRYLHYLVHTRKRFEKVHVTFPIRGHSYMECDKNTGLINTKAVTETPNDWIEVIKSSRCKPSPFKVISVDQSMVRDWASFLEPLYAKKCPFLSRPIRELEVRYEHERMIFHRDSYNGLWTSSIVTLAKRKTIRGPPLQEGEFYYPQQAYQGMFLTNLLILSLLMKLSIQLQFHSKKKSMRT